LLWGCEKELEIPNSQRQFLNRRTDFPVQTLRLTAVGDIMFHHTQLYRGWNREDQRFDFSHSFAQVKKYLSEGDITLGNLETTMSGVNGALVFDKETHYLGYQAYPTFNSPAVIADNLKDAGFDVMLMANNHSMDSGINGIDSTLNEMHRTGLLTVGTAHKEPAAPLTLTIRNMNLKILNWAYGTNGIEIPKEDLSRINSLQNYNADRIETMIQQIKEANASGVDWVIMTIHFGPEYHTQPHERLQQNLVDRMIDAGADIIIGSHPHVLQPMEIRERINEDGSRDQIFVIYSMGNFLASQNWAPSRPWETDSSIILNLDLQMDYQGNKRLAAIEFIPIYTQWNSREIRVIPVEDAQSTDGHEKYGRNAMDRSRLPHIQEYVPRHMMSMMEEYHAELEGDRYRIELKAPEDFNPPMEIPELEGTENEASIN